MLSFEDIKKLPQTPYAPLAQVARKAAAEGSVLLKNDNGVLPLDSGDVISLFGRTQIDYVKSGTGSGGAVRVGYTVNILEGIRNNLKLTLNEELVSVYENWLKDHPFDIGNGWATEPWCQYEMVPDEAIVADARKKSDVAVIVIGRTAGEDKDNGADKGSWYLTDEEEALLEVVSKHFEKTVVLLNVGNIIDMKWVDKYNIKSVMYVWQGGQEGGNAVADLLSGDVNPCGKLTDTIAKDISLYPSVKNFGNPDFNIYAEDIYVGYRYFETFAPDDVLYPFGFGLSYTSFKYEDVKISLNDGVISVDVTVRNTGDFSGKEIVELYFEAPQGLLGKAVRELCGFGKTKLLAPGEAQSMHFEVRVNDMCAYDDGGISGNKSCYILEKGEYNLYMGACVRCAEKIYTYIVAETTLVKKCSEIMAPMQDFEIMHPVYKNGKYEISYKKASKRTVDYASRIKENLPDLIPQTGDKGIKLVDVKNGKNTIEEFVAQLSDNDLMCIVRGEGMCSPKVRPGSAGAVGGVTESLAGFGIPIVALHDGPSGIRMDSGEHATSLPNGTAIASTWDTELAFSIYSNLSIELCTHNIDSILGPGVNIHRVPLNGRNFEYFSEDPYISGKIATALINGVAQHGNSATIKHFTANSQEYKRRDVDSVMSERALREIYLKTFEIPVREAKTTSLMTSYNPVNGIWSANNYELNTIVLREEWGYDGFVVTDWWPKLKKGEDELADYKTLSGVVEGQNDVYMPTPDSLNFKDDLPKALESGRLNVSQLQRNAINILKYLMNSHSFERFVEFGGKLEKSLVDSLPDLNDAQTICNISSGREFAVSLPHPGKYLLCVEYSSDEDVISQMPVNILVDGKSAASLTVNGTKGENAVAYRDISVIAEEIKLVVNYSDKLVNINRIVLKHQ